MQVITRTFASRRLSQQGVALLEFSICLVVIVAFVAGIIDYGIALRHAHLMADVAKNAARAASAYSYDPENSAVDCLALRDEAGKWVRTYLPSNGPDGSIIDPNPNVCFRKRHEGSADEEGADAYLIQVEVTREGAASSFFHLDNILPIFPNITARGVFSYKDGELLKCEEVDHQC